MKTIGFVVFPGFQILDMVAVTVFEVANELPGGPYYKVDMLSEHGGSVASSGSFCSSGSGAPCSILK